MARGAGIALGRFGARHRVRLGRVRPRHRRLPCAARATACSNPSPPCHATSGTTRHFIPPPVAKPHAGIITPAFWIVSRVPRARSGSSSRSGISLTTIGSARRGPNVANRSPPIVAPILRVSTAPTDSDCATCTAKPQNGYKSAMLKITRTHPWMVLPLTLRIAHCV